MIVYTVNQSGVVFNSDGQFAESYQLEFLLKDDSIKLFCNLDQDVSRLLKAVNYSQKHARYLWDTHDGGIPPYRIYYIPGKYFSIETKGHKSEFADMTQYDETLKHVPSDRPEDCISRCKKAAELAREVYNIYLELGYTPDNLISPANLVKKKILPVMDLQKFQFVPREASEFAYECCKGSWIEVFKRGYFKEVWDYDLSSAYSSEAAELLHLERGNWIKSDTYQRAAVYGYARCEVWIDAEFSPIFYKGKDKTFTPRGIWETTLTKSELDFIEKYDLGTCLILDAWWWIPSPTLPKFQPLKGIINNLYAKKEQSAGIKRQIIKGLLNGGFYGVFREVKSGGPGNNFMSPYAAEIETNIRLKVARACIESKITPIAITVDGIVSDKPLNIESRGMGGWKLAYQGKCLSVHTGLVCIDGKEGEGDFALSYHDMMTRIESDPHSQIYKVEAQTVQTIGRALQGNDWASLGNVVADTRFVDIGMEAKRLYSNPPLTGNDLLRRVSKSEAWTIEMLRLINRAGQVPAVMAQQP